MKLTKVGIDINVADEVQAKQVVRVVMALGAGWEQKPEFLRILGQDGWDEEVVWEMSHPERPFLAGRRS